MYTENLNQNYTIYTICIYEGQHDCTGCIFASSNDNYDNGDELSRTVPIFSITHE